MPGQSNNNAAAVLLPDRRTLVQMQPLYRCEPGSPILAKWGADRGCPQTFPNTTDILGDGALGAHGGSGLSSIGGTIRMGELLPGAPPISHALKLELFGHLYYYGGHQLQPKTEENGGRTQVSACFHLLVMTHRVRVVCVACHRVRHVLASTSRFSTSVHWESSKPCTRGLACSTTQ